MFAFGSFVDPASAKQFLHITIFLPQKKKTKFKSYPTFLEQFYY